MPTKRVFADYFTSFYSRACSQDSKIWRYYHGDKVAWSGDLYEHPGQGRKETATPAYPLIGTYDAADPAVQEYHILLAKNAGLDGFFCEYGLPAGHDAQVAENLARLGKRLGFGIGIHWVTHNFTRYAPHAGNRHELMNAAAQCLRTVLRKIYRPAGIFLGRRPVILFFVVRGKAYTDCEIGGTAFSGIELRGLKKALGKIRPRFLSWAFADNFHPDLAPGVDGFYPWMIPAGSPVPPGSLFDTQSTLAQQQQRLRRFYQAARQAQGKFPLTWGGAWTGFDDRRGRAWGEDLARYIPRENGETFRKTWELACASGAQNILLATWNDWVESTQLEPSVELGYTDLENAHRAITAWKKTPCSPQSLRLPIRLFRIRKKLTHFRQAGFTAQSLLPCQRRADRIALALSRQQEEPARRSLLALEKTLEERFEKNLATESVTWRWSPARPGQDLKITTLPSRKTPATVSFTLSASRQRALRGKYALGRLAFQYMDAGTHWIRVWQGSTAAGFKEREIAYFRKHGTRRRVWAELDIEPAFFPAAGLSAARFRIQSENPRAPLRLKEIRLRLTLTARLNPKSA
jgi:hypothetical protein